MKWALAVDGKARLVTTEFFYFIFCCCCLCFFASVGDRRLLRGVRFKIITNSGKVSFSSVKKVSLQIDSQYPRVYGVQLKTYS